MAKEKTLRQAIDDGDVKVEERAGINELLSSSISVKLGPDTYELGPITPKLYKDAKLKLKKDVQQSVEEVLKDIPTKERVDTRIQAAKYIPSSVETQEFLESEEGSLWVIWWALNKNHPELTEDNLLELANKYPEDFEVLVSELGGEEAPDPTERTLRE